MRLRWDVAIAVVAGCLAVPSLASCSDEPESSPPQVESSSSTTAAVGSSSSTTAAIGEVRLVLPQDLVTLLPPSYSTLRRIESDRTGNIDLETAAAQFPGAANPEVRSQSRARLTTAGFVRGASVDYVDNPRISSVTLLEVASPEAAQAYVEAERVAWQALPPFERYWEISETGPLEIRSQAKSGYWNLHVRYSVGQVVVSEQFVAGPSRDVLEDDYTTFDALVRERLDDLPTEPT